MKLTVAFTSVCLTMFTLGVYGQSPCSDSLYLVLKKRDINSLSQREYDYLMLKEEYCLKSNLSAGAAQSNSTRLCTLTVTVDKTHFNGQKMPIGVYIDGAAKGFPPQTIAVAPGRHEVNLFSPDGHERRLNFGIPNRLNKTSSITVDCQAQKSYAVSYTFKCTDAPSDCDEDKWYFLADVGEEKTVEF